MGKFNRKSMDTFNRKFPDMKGYWGRKTQTSEAKGRFANVVNRNYQDSEYFRDYSYLDMRQEQNQSQMIWMAQEIGPNYENLKELHHKMKVDLLIAKKRAVELQNEIGEMKNRLRIANERALCTHPLDIRKFT